VEVFFLVFRSDCLLLHVLRSVSELGIARECRKMLCCKACGRFWERVVVEAFHRGMINGC